MEKVLEIWIEDQASHNIPSSQNLVQSKALSPILEGREARKLQKQFEAISGWFMKFK